MNIFLDTSFLKWNFFLIFQVVFVFHCIHATTPLLKWVISFNFLIMFLFLLSWQLKHWIPSIPITWSEYPLGKHFSAFLSLFRYSYFVPTNESSLIDCATKFQNFLASDWLLGFLETPPLTNWILCFFWLQTRD